MKSPMLIHMQTYFFPNSNSISISTLNPQFLNPSSYSTYQTSSGPQQSAKDHAYIPDTPPPLHPH